MSEPTRLRDDFGWQSIRKSAVMAPSAVIVEALCDYAEGQTDRLTEALEAAEREKAALHANLLDWKEHTRRAEADLATARRRLEREREHSLQAEAALAERKAMLHDAKVRLDTQTDMTAKADESAERWYDRALVLEADLADEKRRHEETLDRAEGAENNYAQLLLQAKSQKRRHGEPT